MRWTLGEDLVQRLVDDRELQRVPMAQDLAEALLTTAYEHLTSASEIRGRDPDGAYALAYDAVRKSCAALLQAEGLRPTASGGHVAVKDVVMAQFGQSSSGRALRRFDQMRRRRNSLEYPSQPAERVGTAELDEALAWASEIVDFCKAVLPQLDLF